MPKFRAEHNAIARLLASKDTHVICETEFQHWKLLMNFGAQSLEAQENYEGSGKGCPSAERAPSS